MVPSPHLETLRLAGLRRLIDAVDDGLLALLAVRGGLASRTAGCKRAAGLPLRDPLRERAVRRRAARLARRLGLGPETAAALTDLAIADALRRQRIPADLGQGAAGTARRTIAPRMDTVSVSASEPAPRWLRYLPPPARWARLLRRIPPHWQQPLLERMLAEGLAAPRRAGALDFLRERRLGIEVSDLGLHWVITLDDSGLRLCRGAAEASVRGSATDLLLLAGRLEDADTLFFQRRLVLTGDTELGLTARNLLDGLPWEQIPLPLRIALNRAARWAARARAAYHDSARLAPAIATAPR